MVPLTTTITMPITPEPYPSHYHPTCHTSTLPLMHCLSLHVVTVASLPAACLLIPTVLFVDVGNNRAVLDSLPNSFVSNSNTYGTGHNQVTLPCPYSHLCNARTHICATPYPYPCNARTCTHTYMYWCVRL